MPFASPIPEKILKALLLALLLLVLGVFHLEPINLTTADLGRHIKNGEVFIKEGKVLDTNFYSYTQPEYSTINHHWGSGVAFYFLHQWVEFKGIAFIFVGMFLLTFGIIFRVACRYANFWIVYFVAVANLPLLVTRTEIRPEGFSYLFIAIFLWVLFQQRDSGAASKRLWILPVVEILWVNCHIFFVFGPLLIAIFAFDAFLKDEKGRVTSLLKVFVFCVAATLVNPFFVAGALAPLTIFKDYGYQLAENQSAYFMIKRMPDQLVYPHFVWAFLLAALSATLALAKDSFKKWALAIVTLAAFSVLGFLAIRGFKLFAIMSLVFTPIMLDAWLKRHSQRARQTVILAMGVLSFSLLSMSVASKSHYYSPFQPLNIPYFMNEWGVAEKKTWFLTLLRNINRFAGTFPYIDGSAEFVKANKIQGPIFNNYDIGGYLIYYFYPQEKVFVDNRPEAYSSEFFESIYGPMQEDESSWAKYSQEYGFNVIYFYRHDMTTWAQPFLIRRLLDDAWAPVFVDPFVLVLLKRNEQNSSIIRRYEIPRSYFKLSPNK